MLKSQFFKASEWACHCGCGAVPQQALLDRLDKVRKAFGSPIGVRDMARCAKHNAALIPPGAPHSQHISGTAADLVLTPDLGAFLEANLAGFDLYMEAPSCTPTWRHVQLVAPKSGRRIFWP